MIAQLKTLRTFLFTFVAAAAVSINLTACSSGTEPGDANVEKGTTKHRNPAHLNAKEGSGDRGSTSEEERDETKTNDPNQKNYYEGEAKKERERK